MFQLNNWTVGDKKYENYKNPNILEKLLYVTVSSPYQDMQRQEEKTKLHQVGSNIAESQVSVTINEFHEHALMALSFRIVYVADIKIERSRSSQ